MFRLMIKTHTVTGLKYLCMTKREKWKEYSGSGVYWTNHLRKHGYSFGTELIFESEDYSEFVEQCLVYSGLFDVAMNEEFANLIPESGYGNEEGICNLTLWWKYANEEARRACIEARKAGQIDNHWANLEDGELTSSGRSREQISRLIGDANRKHWSEYSLDERREMTNLAREGVKRFYSNRESDQYKAYVALQSERMKSQMANTSFDVLSERNRKHRLELSPEKAKIRADKIKAVWATGKHDHLFEKMSEIRKGSGNPAAKITVWMDIEYTKGEFSRFCKENSISKETIEFEFENNPEKCYKDYDDSHLKYEQLTCPYCGLVSGMNKKPSGFKRFHFDKCKKKIEENYED